VHQSGRLVLPGSSDCGKSKLLEAVSGYMAPVAGGIRLKGQHITRSGPNRDDGAAGVRPAAGVEDGAALEMSVEGMWKQACARGIKRLGNGPARCAGAAVAQW
jgi:ABC-type taurine transport system ATPase subunit